MAHDHSHGHGHPPSSRTTLAWALGLTITFAAVEAVSGWLAGSLALLGDAGHMVSDSTALGLAALAAWIARHPPTRRHSYGLQRAEVVAALVNGLIMLAIVAGIAIAAVERLQSPRPVGGLTVMLVAAIGLVINAVVAVVLARGEQSLNTRGALLHVMGDLLGSVAALLAGAIVHFTGWLPIDPLLSLLICLLILFSAVRLLRDGLHVIMEGVPRDLDLREVGQTMAGVPGVREVHDLHIWTLSSGLVALSAHVVVSDAARWDDTLAALQRKLADEFAIEHVTLQPERPVAVQAVPLERESRAD